MKINKNDNLSNSSLWLLFLVLNQKGLHLVDFWFYISPRIESFKKNHNSSYFTIVVWGGILHLEMEIVVKQILSLIILLFIHLNWIGILASSLWTSLQWVSNVTSTLYYFRCKNEQNVGFGFYCSYSLVHIAWKIFSI